MTLGSDLRAYVPSLLGRARALLRLPGGPPDRLAPAELGPASRAVAALHEGLVGSRALARAATYGEPAHLGAYLLWWWPQSYAKARAALRLLPGPLPPGARVLDVGAGPAPAALAALDHLAAAGGKGEAVATDASEAALACACALAGPRPLRTEVRRVEAGGASAGPFDLAVASNVLSELELAPAARAAALAALAGRALAPEGTLLLIEPALRETGRALLEVRDALLAGHGLRAVAPCLTQKPCPALRAPRDWCTAAQPWDAPAHLEQLAGALGLRSHLELSFAYVALARSRTPAEPAAPGLWRVVGVPPREKGKRRVFVCSDEGRLAVSRLDREASASNEGFEALERGDLVRLGGLGRRGDGLRAGPDASVERVAPGEQA